MSTLYGLGSEIGEEITLYPGDFSLTLDTETDTLEVEIFELLRPIEVVVVQIRGEKYIKNKRQGVFT